MESYQDQNHQDQALNRSHAFYSVFCEIREFNKEIMENDSLAEYFMELENNFYSFLMLNQEPDAPKQTEENCIAAFNDLINIMKYNPSFNTLKDKFTQNVVPSFNSAVEILEEQKKKAYASQVTKYHSLDTNLQNLQNKIDPDLYERLDKFKLGRIGQLNYGSAAPDHSQIYLVIRAEYHASIRSSTLLNFFNIDSYNTEAMALKNYLDEYHKKFNPPVTSEFQNKTDEWAQKLIQFAKDNNLTDKDSLEIYELAYKLLTCKNVENLKVITDTVITNFNLQPIITVIMCEIQKYTDTVTKTPNTPLGKMYDNLNPKNNKNEQDKVTKARLCAISSALASSSNPDESQFGNYLQNQSKYNIEFREYYSNKKPAHYYTQLFLAKLINLESNAKFMDQGKEIHGKNWLILKLRKDLENNNDLQLHDVMKLLADISKKLEANENPLNFFGHHNLRNFINKFLIEINLSVTTKLLQSEPKEKANKTSGKK